MNYAPYDAFAELINDRSVPGNANREMMAEFASAIRAARGRKSNLDIYRELIPFALEANISFPRKDDDGSNWVNEALSNFVQGKYVSRVPIFSAWFWYWHENEARQFHKRHDFSPAPYVGTPDLRKCSDEIKNIYERRKVATTQHLNKGSLNADKLRISRASYVALSMLLCIVMALSIVIFAKNTDDSGGGIEPGPTGGGEVPTIVTPDQFFATHTFCSFFERWIARGRKYIEGRLHVSMGVPLDIGEDEYVHLTGEIAFHAPRPDRPYPDDAFWGTLQPTVRGSPVNVEYIEDNRFVGTIGERTIFNFILAPETGKYIYQQFEAMDQPLKDFDGYVFYIKIPFHHHKNGTLANDKAIWVIVYDERHSPSDTKINGVRVFDD